MSVWNKSRMQTVYYDNDPSEEDECDVKIDSKEIVVSYRDDSGFVNYRGKNDGTGHFELLAPERNGRATLHMFKDSSILEGFWEQEGYRGFWRIYLS
jgi:hypothetical protein